MKYPGLGRWVMAALLLPVFAFAGEVMTLDQCVEKGLALNPLLKASEYGIEAAEHEVGMARAEFMPSISSGYSVSRISSISAKGQADTDYLDQDMRAFNVKISQILFAGARVLNAYHRAKINRKIAQAEKDLNQLELVYNIETNFYRMMRARENVEIARESVKRLEESVKSAMAFFDRELVPYVEVLQARVDLADAKEQLAIAQNEVNRERIGLFALMGLPPDETIVFDDGVSSVPVLQLLDVESYMKMALEKRPDIKTLQYQLALAEKDRQISLGKYLPIVQMEAGYYDQDRDYQNPGTSFTGDFDRDQRNRYWSAGVSATWNMFDGGRAWQEMGKYASDYLRIKMLIRRAEKEIFTGIHKALYSMSEARQRISSAVSALTAAREYYAREESRLKSGISTIPALLDAQTRLSRSQGNHIRAILDFQLAVSELKMMTGGEND